MSKDGNDLYKAAIGAPDNFMSTYYHTEFKKLDEARKKERENLTRSNASSGGSAQGYGNKDIFGLDALNKPKKPQQEMTKEEKEGFDEGAKFLLFIGLSIGLFYVLMKFLIAVLQVIGSLIN